MFISVMRYHDCPDSTGGLLFVNGEFFCYTCEDQAQPDGKVAGETRIPAGTYDVILRNEGGMTQRYAHKFPEIHRGMLWLQNVPNFEWVYLHIGNTDDDTLGCLLVGCTPGRSDDREAKVYSSKDAYQDLYKRCVDALDLGEQIVIDIQDAKP